MGILCCCCLHCLPCGGGGLVFWEHYLWGSLVVVVVFTAYLVVGVAWFVGSIIYGILCCCCFHCLPCGGCGLVCWEHYLWGSFVLLFSLLTLCWGSPGLLVALFEGILCCCCFHCLPCGGVAWFVGSIISGDPLLLFSLLTLWWRWPGLLGALFVGILCCCCFHCLPCVSTHRISDPRWGPPSFPPTRQAGQPPPRGSSTNPRPLV